MRWPKIGEKVEYRDSVLTIRNIVSCPFRNAMCSNECPGHYVFGSFEMCPDRGMTSRVVLKFKPISKTLEQRDRML